MKKRAASIRKRNGVEGTVRSSKFKRATERCRRTLVNAPPSAFRSAVARFKNTHVSTVSRLVEFAGGVRWPQCVLAGRPRGVAGPALPVRAEQRKERKHGRDSRRSSAWTTAGRDGSGCWRPAGQDRTPARGWVRVGSRSESQTRTRPRSGRWPRPRRRHRGWPRSKGWRA